MASPYVEQKHSKQQLKVTQEVSSGIHFANQFLSLDGIPEIESETMNPLFGTSNGTYNGESRTNCCWLETGLLLLLCDPYLRPFIHQYAQSGESALVPSNEILDADQRHHYDLAKILVRVLDFRWKQRESVLEQKSFDRVMTQFMSEIRQQFDRCAGGNINAADANGMGDPVEFVQYALSGLRMLIAVNSPTISLQRLYNSFGYAIVQRRDVLCVNEKCAKFNKELTEYCFVDDHNPFEGRGIAALSVLGGQGFFTGVRVSKDTTLQKLLAERFNTIWIIADQTCNQDPNDCIDTRLISKRRLVNLPWMLYIPIVRQSVPGHRLTYGQKLIVGPTVDGQSAVYDLVARIRRQGSQRHYVIDVRDPVTGQFQNHDFARKTTSSNIESDTDGFMLLWQRQPRSTA